MFQKALLLVAVAACLSSVHPVWSQSRLPDENGQDAVEPLSSGYHQLRCSEWRDVIDRMVDFGAPLSRDCSVASAKHLVQNLPETMKRPAAMNPGSAEVSIKEWLVLTPGSHPHDPLAAADGSICIRAKWPTFWGGSIQRPGSSRNIN